MRPLWTAAIRDESEHAGGELLFPEPRMTSGFNLRLNPTHHRQNHSERRRQGLVTPISLVTPVKHKQRNMTIILSQTQRRVRLIPLRLRSTFTFRAFSRHFYTERLTMSTFVMRSATIYIYISLYIIYIYLCLYSKDVHRTK